VWAAILLLTLALRGPHALFLLPRTRPGLWAAICLMYPLLSVYPQEIMFRTFFFHRYGALFRSPVAAVLTNAVLFGWAHVMVHNWTAVLMTAVGGVLFATTYQRSRSTLLVAVEHALYGDFVFSVGIGGMFVNGVRLLTKVMGSG
jgi:membrane protease YdiL (CAAX protease family)